MTRSEPDPTDPLTTLLNTDTNRIIFIIIFDQITDKIEYYPIC
jgi:hypothetical protein